MEIEAPTFNALNTAQKRALILRDQLRWNDPHHLDSFIEGLANVEPPSYQRCKGVIKPRLSLVALKESASRFDLGNVLFPEEDKGVLHAYLVHEEGSVEIFTEQPLPERKDSLNSVAIHGFIASTMIPIFKEKIGLIMTRVNKYNEARRAAYDSPVIVPFRFASVETLSRPQAPRASFTDEQDSLALRQRTRKPNTTVAPHITNKRPLVGLASIPTSLKTTWFNAIPEQVKVNLFNSIAQTAFPNFDNLMIAGWNAVSVYSTRGSDFSEMHKAIVELKDVLQDFDVAFGVKAAMTQVQLRSDWAGETHSGPGNTQALASVSSGTQARGETSKIGSGEAKKGSGQQVRNANLGNDERAAVKRNKGLRKRDHPGKDFHYGSESSSGEDEIPAQRPVGAPDRQQHKGDKPVIASSSQVLTPPTSVAPTFPSQLSTAFAVNLTGRILSRSAAAYQPPREPPATPVNRFAHVPQASVAAPLTAPIPTQPPSSPASGKTTAYPELSRPRNDRASNVAKTKLRITKATQSSPTKSPSPHLQTHPTLLPQTTPPVPRFSSPAPYAPPPPSPFASLAPAPAPPTIHPPKRKASTSLPFSAKRKQLVTYTTTQLLKKQHSTRTSIMRQWGTLDPNVAPRQYLGLLTGLEAELERREGREKGNACDEEGQGEMGDFEHEDGDGEEGEKKGDNGKSRDTVAQNRTEDSISGPRPILQGMFGPYLGKSVLGEKKSGGRAPVAQMLGTGTGRGLGGKKEGGGNGGGGKDE